MNDVFSIEISRSISEALNLINQNKGKNIFVLDDGKFCGTVSDGDLRRAILNGFSLDAEVRSATNFNAVWVSLDDSNTDVNKIFLDEHDLLPVLDRSHRITRVLKKGEKLKIPLAEPNLSNRETELVLDTLFSTMISSRGSYVGKFESLFAQYLDIDPGRVVTVSNGTLAIYLALISLGITEGDEVIVPDMTFGATANAVIQAGAKPILVDVEDKTWNLDLNLLSEAITPRTKAIIPVHLYGNPIELNELKKFADDHDLLVIEDAAEAIGTHFQNSHVGINSNASTFSFFGNKTITTGEGGMVVFKDLTHANKAREIKNHGMDKNVRYFHNDWGTNLRLTNIQAAIGCAQMERVNQFMEQKNRNNDVYRLHLDSYGIVFADVINSGVNSFWLTSCLLPKSIDVTKCLDYLSKNGIEARSFFYPLHIQPAFEHYTYVKKNSSISQKLFERGISLPSGTTLTSADLLFICQTLINYLEQAK
jgi:perosamine synthetase